jgi:LysM repeat protein
MKPALALLLAAVLLLHPAAPVKAACGSTYTVQPGDTLYSIGADCGVSYVVLVSINYELSSPDKIWPGQVIRLVAEAPLDQAHPPASGPGVVAGYQPGGAYVVRRGDSLSRIAYLYDTTVPELLYANPQIIGTVIQPGQVLVLPLGARHEKGWVGVSTLTARGGTQIVARVVDFPAYANVEFRLMLTEENDDDYFQVFRVETDAHGEAHAELRLPLYVAAPRTWEVRVFNMDDPESRPIHSPVIRIGS